MTVVQQILQLSVAGVEAVIGSYDTVFAKIHSVLDKLHDLVIPPYLLNSSVIENSGDCSVDVTRSVAICDLGKRADVEGVCDLPAMTLNESLPDDHS